MVKEVLSCGGLGRKPSLYLWSPCNLDLSLTSPRELHGPPNFSKSQLS